MTNGEKLVEIFPNNTHITLKRTTQFAINPMTLNQQMIVVDNDWWNAEYKEPTTKNDLALIHTEGLDEEIRCTMCTNHMKSDRGCDGSCVVNKDMYKAVMDAIEKRIQPTTKNDLSVEELANKLLKAMDFTIRATDSKNAYGAGVRSGIGYCKSLIFEHVPENNVGNIEPTKNDLEVDCISRKAVFEAIDDCNRDGLKGIFCSYDDGERFKEYIKNLPSVTPLSSELEKNSKKLEKNFGESDCIDRAELLKAMGTWDKFGYTARYGLERLDKDDKGFVPYVKYDDMVNCVKNMPSVTPQEPRCKNCKWWKDSDGTYRRGCGAESQCPINRREVFEGNGYCFLFEPQKSEDKE